MHRRFEKSLVCAAIFGGTIALGLGSTGASAAEETAAGPIGPIPEIVVVLPEIVNKKVVGRSNVGAPIEVLTLTRRVSYADLDLLHKTDIDELHKRIRDTAKGACEELERQYPAFDSSAVHSCAKIATDEAMEVADAVVAATAAQAKK